MGFQYRSYSYSGDKMSWLNKIRKKQQTMSRQMQDMKERGRQKTIKQKVEKIDRTNKKMEKLPSSSIRRNWHEGKMMKKGGIQFMGDLLYARRYEREQKNKEKKSSK